jgi:hypothetical protein
VFTSFTVFDSDTVQSYSRLKMIWRCYIDLTTNFSGMFQVCAPSCHDCSTLRAWWEEDEGRRSRFYKTVVGSSEESPSRCSPEVVHFIVQQHFDAPSMWAIFPLQVTFIRDQRFLSEISR